MSLINKKTLYKQYWLMRITFIVVLVTAIYFLLLDTVQLE